MHGKFSVFVNGNYVATWVKVVYTSSSFGLLALESRDLSKAEKEIIVCQAEQFHKMTLIFTQNGPSLSV